MLSMKIERIALLCGGLLVALASNQADATTYAKVPGKAGLVPPNNTHLYSLYSTPGASCATSTSDKPFQIWLPATATTTTGSYTLSASFAMINPGPPSAPFTPAGIAGRLLTWSSAGQLWCATAGGSNYTFNPGVISTSIGSCYGFNPYTQTADAEFTVGCLYGGQTYRTILDSVQYSY